MPTIGMQQGIKQGIPTKVYMDEYASRQSRGQEISVVRLECTRGHFNFVGANPTLPTSVKAMPLVCYVDGQRHNTANVVLECQQQETNSTSPVGFPTLLLNHFVVCAKLNNVNRDAVTVFYRISNDT